MMTIFKIIVYTEWTFFFISMIVIVILLNLLKRVNEHQLIRLSSLTTRKYNTLIEINTMLQSSATTLRVVRTNIFMSSLIIIASLFGILYLVETRLISTLLPKKILILGVLSIIPLPFAVLMFELIIKKTIEQIDKLKGILP